MSIFDSNYSILKRSSPAKMGKRFVCCVIDMVIVFLVAAAIFAGAFAITENSASYKKASETIVDETNYFEKELMADTYLLEYSEGSRVRNDVVSYINLLKAIKASYDFNGLDFSGFYSKLSEDSYNEMHTKLSEPDAIVHFYTIYYPANSNVLTYLNLEGKTPLEYLYSRYTDNNAFGENDFNNMFIKVDNENYKGPILKKEVAESLYHYITNSENEEKFKEGQAWSDLYVASYTTMVNEALTVVGYSEPYYSTHYLVYANAECQKAGLTNLALIISLFLAYCIAILLPKFLFKNEKSIGYKLLGLGVIRIDGKENPWYYSLLKMIPEFIGFVIVIFFMYLLPPFSGNYKTMFIGFTVNSYISLGIIILAITILGCIINAFGLFTHYRQTLVNMIFKDMVVDTRYIDEGDRDDVFEGRPY